MIIEKEFEAQRKKHCDDEFKGIMAARKSAKLDVKDLEKLDQGNSQKKK